MKVDRTSVKKIVSLVSSFFIVVFSIAFQCGFSIWKDKQYDGSFFMKGETYNYCERLSTAYTKINKKGYTICIENGDVNDNSFSGIHVFERILDDNGMAIFDFRITNYNSNELSKYFYDYVPGTYKSGDETTRPVSSFVIGKETFIATIYGPDALFKSDYKKQITCEIRESCNTDFSIFINTDADFKIETASARLNELFITGFSKLKDSAIKSNIKTDIYIIGVSLIFDFSLVIMNYLLFNKSKKSIFYATLYFCSSIISIFAYKVLGVSFVIANIILFILAIIIFNCFSCLTERKKHEE